MTTREQQDTIEDLSLEHSTVECHSRATFIRVRCEDGFSCDVDEDGRMSNRRGHTAIRKGKGWE